MRTMYDSTNPFDIPTDAEMVGYYVDGIYAVSETIVRSRFPRATLVGISAIGSNAGVVGDVEPGCMTDAQAVHWVTMRRAAGIDPTIYCNQTYGWWPVRLAFQAAKVPEPHYWVANYDRIIAVPLGAIAKQYTNPTYSGGHYDLSCVADFWPGVDSAEEDVTPEQDAALTEALNGVRDLNGALFYPPTDPTYGNFARLFETKLKAAAANPLPATVDLTPVLNALAAQKVAVEAIGADVAALKRRVEKDLAP